MTLFAVVALLLAALPAVLAVANLRILRPPEPGPLPPKTLVSILIPARNEAGNIGPALEAARTSGGVGIEILVMDDGSTDETAAIVADRAARDPRIRVLTAPSLPEGWTGKVHACQRLAEAAAGTHLLFIDADVRLAPGAAAALAAHAGATGAGLVSAVPRQIIGSPGEALTVPMINFLLLGYLPIGLMRRRPHDPGLGAACGQLILVDREAYFSAGGHAAFRGMLHDGIQLARLFRRAGFRTDLVAGADLASCRMYASFGEAWAGFIKNAHEGMATPKALPVWTVLLFGGHVLPVLLVGAAALGSAPLALPLAALALSLGARAAITLATRETLAAVPLHPFAVLVTLAIQWSALLRVRNRGSADWKGRFYPAG